MLNHFIRGQHHNPVKSESFWRYGAAYPAFRWADGAGDSSPDSQITTRYNRDL